MDTTRINPSVGQSLPGPAPSIQPQAYHQAPTLMAAAIPGVQGAVIVWSPDKKLLRRAAMMLYLNPVLLAVALLVPLISHRLPWFFYVFNVSLCCFLIIRGLPLYRQSARRILNRPLYLTTDGNGIGVSTKSGSAYVRWIDIQSAQPTWDTIELKVPDRVEIELTGFPDAHRRELLDCIVTSAGLRNTQGDNRLFSRAGTELSAQGSSFPALTQTDSSSAPGTLNPSPTAREKLSDE